MLSSLTSVAHKSTTLVISSSCIDAIVRLCLAEKQTTLAIPVAPLNWNKSSFISSLGSIFSLESAEKSFSNTKVSLKSGFISPFARVLVGQR